MTRAGGLAFMEQLPSLEHLLSRHIARIDAMTGPTAEKEQAKFRLKDELLKIGIQKGADVAIAHAPAAIQQLQTIFATWFKA